MDTGEITGPSNTGTFDQKVAGAITGPSAEGEIV